jgi:hypothetical protein
MLFELSRLRRYTIPLLLILSALAIAQETRQRSGFSRSRHAVPNAS